jgi:hypothetical protein
MPDFSYESIDRSEHDRQLRSLLLEQAGYIDECRKLAERIRMTASGVEDCEDALVQESEELRWYGPQAEDLGLKLAVVRAEIAAMQKVVRDE